MTVWVVVIECASIGTRPHVFINETSAREYLKTSRDAYLAGDLDMLEDEDLDAGWFLITDRAKGSLHRCAAY